MNILVIHSVISFNYPAHILIVIDTFLSHSDKDKKIARKFADSLSVYGFDVFVAHDDIGIGEDWEEILKERIKDCELFIALLSKNFCAANFTDHEVGIAVAFNKQIFPIRIDETKPYGFMSKFQAKKISSKIEYAEMQSLAESLLTFTKEGKNLIDRLIEKLCNSDSFDTANITAEILFEYTNFTHMQINKIAKTFISNNHVRGGWTARPSCLDFLARNWDFVDQEYQSTIKKYYGN